MVLRRRGFIKLTGAALAASTLGFFHWVVVGRNEVQPEDEAEAQRLMRESRDPK